MRRARTAGLPAFALSVALLGITPRTEAQASGAATAVTEARIEVQVVVPRLQEVLLGGPVHPLPDVTAMDLMAGFIEPAQPIRLIVFSNCPWELRLRRAAGGATATRPGTEILWSRGRSAFARLADDWTVAATDRQAGGTRVDLQIRIPLGWSSTPPGVLEPRLEVDLAPAEI